MAPRKKKAIELPLLPLRDVVVFPYMVMPLFVGREKINSSPTLGDGFQ